MSAERRPGSGDHRGDAKETYRPQATAGHASTSAAADLSESHWDCPGCTECNDLVNGLARQVGVYTVGTSDVDGCPQDVVDLTARQHLEEVAAVLWGEPCRWCGAHHPADDDCADPCGLCGDRHPLEGACTL